MMYLAMSPLAFFVTKSIDHVAMTT